MEKGHICKFVKCNNCKEREDHNLCVKLGHAHLPQDASSNSQKKTSDCNDPLLHNHKKNTHNTNNRWYLLCPKISQKDSQ